MFTPLFSAIAGKIGVTELLVILVIVLVIFGPKQLPKLSRMFGKTVNSFKKGLDEGLEDDEDKTPAEGAKAVESEEKKSSEDSQ